MILFKKRVNDDSWYKRRIVKWNSNQSVQVYTRKLKINLFLHKKMVRVSGDGKWILVKGSHLNWTADQNLYTTMKWGDRKT